MTSRPGSPVTVAVTGIGAIIGQGIARSLRQLKSNIRIVGIDLNPEAPGWYFSDVFIPKPAVAEDSDAYHAFWMQTLRANHVDLVLPGLDVDAAYFAAAGDVGTKVALNATGLISAASDKWGFLSEARPSGVPLIPTIIPESWENACDVLGDPPFVLKPRRGSGSRGVVRIDCKQDFAYWLSRGKASILQRYVGSDQDEYTVGAFGLGDGRSLEPIIFRRLLSPTGNTKYAEVVHHDEIAAEVRRLSEYFQPRGPTNYQFRVEHGIPYLLEINPRFSSSSSLRAAFGYNEADMSLQWYLEGREPACPRIRGGRAWRYFEDIVE